MRELAVLFRRFLRHKWTLLAGFACIPLASLGDVWITQLIGGALDRLRQGPYAQARRVFGAEVFVNDDDGKTKFHGMCAGAAKQARDQKGKCKVKACGRLRMADVFR